MPNLDRRLRDLEDSLQGPEELVVIGCPAAFPDEPWPPVPGGLGPNVKVILIRLLPPYVEGEDISKRLGKDGV
jgi:hypothetical protein